MTAGAPGEFHHPGLGLGLGLRFRVTVRVSVRDRVGLGTGVVKFSGSARHDSEGGDCDEVICAG